MRRRRVLEAVAGASLAATAGCLGSDEHEYATVQRLVLVNSADDPVTVELRIERLDDTVAHENAYDLPSGLDGQVVDCVWPDEPIRVLVRRASDDEWSRYETADRAGCVRLLCDAHERGVSFLDAQTDCPIRNPTCHEDVSSARLSSVSRDTP